MFHLLNLSLSECTLSEKTKNDYYLFSTLLMCQPLPLSLIPLETERVMVNERLLPGITKILRVAQNFPSIDVDPSELMGSHDVIQSLNSVFVHENPADSASNGVLNLLEALP